MKSYKTVDEFILNVDNGKDILIVLRDIIKSTGLEETVKWGAPCYTYKGKNIVGLEAFKSYTGLWFFQGALLKDSKNVFMNPREDKTKAMRQWRFNSVEEINQDILMEYIAESIENVKRNKEIKPDRSKPVIIPDELIAEFDNSSVLKTSFNNLTKGKQREYADYISQAKQEKTRLSRMQKVIPLILQGIGLNDKYRK